MNKSRGLKKWWKSDSDDESGTPARQALVNHEETEPTMPFALTRTKTIELTNSKELFESQLRNTYRQAYNLAYRLTGNATDAEDLVQETYLRAYRFFHRYDPSLPFLNWLCRIMGNAHIDSVRKKGRVKVSSIDQVGQPGSQTFELPDWESCPDRAMIDQAFSEHVQEGLSNITPEFRTAVLLADVEGLEYEDIAQVMNTSIGTVRSRIHRGRKQLRSFLTKRCPDLMRCVDEL